MSLKGNLKHFSLSQILTTISERHYSGTLRITYGRDALETTCYIYFAQGALSLASTASRKGFRLGELLVREKKLTQAQLTKALALQKKGKLRLGEILLKKRFLLEEDLTDVLKKQLLEELYDLFLLQSGEFEFRLNEGLPSGDAALQNPINLTLDPQPLIQKGIRRFNLWQTIQKHISTGNEIFIQTGQTAGGLQENHTEVLKLINGRLPLIKIAQQVAMGRFQCAKSAYELIQGRLIRPLTLEELGTQVQGTEDPEEQAAFYCFALQLNPTDLDLRLNTADAFAQSGQRETALQVLLDGLPMLHQASDDMTFRLARNILALAPFHEQTLEIMTNTALRLDKLEDAIEAALELATLLMMTNQTIKTGKILDKIDDKIPDDPEIRERLCTLWETANQPAKAMPHLTFLEKHYEYAQDDQRLKAVIQRILAITPNRHDLEVLLARLDARSKGTTRRPMRKALIAAGLTLAVFGPVAFALTYEYKARVAYADLENQAPSLIMAQQFDQLAAMYEQFMAHYGWSPQTRKAEAALDLLHQLSQKYR